jgi:hypothetical protein
MKQATWLLAGLAGVTFGGAVHGAELTPVQKQMREIYQELVETNTTNSIGSCTVAANKMAKRLKAAGYKRRRPADHRAARRSDQGQPGGQHEGRRQQEAAAAAGPRRRGGGQPRGLGARSVQAGRGRRRVLRPRLVGRQGDGGLVRRQHDPLQARTSCALPSATSSWR